MRNTAPLHLIFVVVALVCFAFAAFVWPPTFDPHRRKLMSAGLFFWVLSSFFSP